MREASKAVALLVVGILLGLTFGYDRWSVQQPTYHDSRAGYIQLNASVAGRQDTVVLGDSVIESTWTEGACGRTFNAGMAGAKVHDVHRLARKILPDLKPSTIIVSVGANHFWNGDRELPAFRTQYRDLIADLPQARLVLLGVPNSSAASADVRQFAREKGALFVPPVRGSLPDGVHLTPSDALRLRERLRQACASMVRSDPAGQKEPNDSRIASR